MWSVKESRVPPREIQCELDHSLHTAENTHTFHLLELGGPTLTPTGRRCELHAPSAQQEKLLQDQLVTFKENKTLPKVVQETLQIFSNSLLISATPKLIIQSYSFLETGNLEELNNFLKSKTSDILKFSIRIYTEGHIVDLQSKNLWLWLTVALYFIISKVFPHSHLDLCVCLFVSKIYVRYLTLSYLTLFSIQFDWKKNQKKIKYSCHVSFIKLFSICSIHNV